MSNQASKFTAAKKHFDTNEGRLSSLAESLVPVDGKTVKNIVIRNSSGKQMRNTLNGSLSMP